MSNIKNTGIIRLIIFGAVFLLLLTAASALSTPVKWFDDNRVQNRNARITEMMKQGNCSEPPAYCRTISAFPAKAAVNAS